MTLLAEIQAKCPLPMLASRNDEAIAATVNVGRTAVKECWLTDLGLVSELVNASGSNALSDSILTKLDALAASSRSTKAVMSRLETGVRGVNFGDAAMRAQFGALEQAGIFTSNELAALLALAVVPDPVSVDDVSDTLNAAGL